MGELFLSLKIGEEGEACQVIPIPRKLVWGNKSFSLREVLELPGGLIVGEGDAGKTTFASMLTDEAAGQLPALLVSLRNCRTDPHDAGDEIWARCEDTLSGCAPGQKALVVLDGLDERADLTPVILDLMRKLNALDRYRIWITSRPGNAASRIDRSGCCPRRYRLEPFTIENFYDLAAQLGFNPDDVHRRVILATGSDSFLTKPGGAMLMLELYSQGALDGMAVVNPETGRQSVMRTITRHFALTSRDGFTDNVDNQRLDKRIDAAKWVAACLFFSGKDAVSNRANAGPRELSVLDIPDMGDTTREHVSDAFGSRLFEPLSSSVLRPAYSAMAAYLAGDWILRSPVRHHLNDILPDANAPFSTFMAEVVSWVALSAPDLGLAYVTRRPLSFFPCHATIRLLGVDRYFDALLPSDLTDPDLFLYWSDHRHELKGFRELEAEAQTRLQAANGSDAIRTLATNLMAATRCDRQRSVRLIAHDLATRKTFTDADEGIAANLENLCEDGDDVASLSELQPFLHRPVETVAQAMVVGIALRLLQCFRLTGEEIVAVLSQFDADDKRLTGIITEAPPNNLNEIMSADDLLPLLRWATELFRSGHDLHDVVREFCLHVVDSSRTYASDARLAKAVEEADDAYRRLTDRDCRASDETDDATDDADETAPCPPVLRLTHLADILPLLETNDEKPLDLLQENYENCGFGLQDEIRDLDAAEAIRLCDYLERHRPPDADDATVRSARREACDFYFVNASDVILAKIDEASLDLLRSLCGSRCGKMGLPFLLTEAERTYAEKSTRLNVSLAKLVALCQGQGTDASRRAVSLADKRQIAELTAEEIDRRKVHVRIEDGQMSELTKKPKKALSRLSKQITTVQKTVNGEPTRTNEKSRANAFRVKDAVERYYALIANGTPRRRATTDACRQTEEQHGLGDYGSFGSFRDAVKRTLDERDRRYGDRAAPVWLPGNGTAEP